jgi:hypothetical protein
MAPDWIIRFYNQRGTAEQYIKEGKQAINWTRLSCNDCDPVKSRVGLPVAAAVQSKAMGFCRWTPVLGKHHTVLPVPLLT